MKTIKKSWVSLVAPCRIPSRGSSADKMLDRHSKDLYADTVDPIKFKCDDCGQEDERITTNRDEWAQMSCSNCYSDHMLIVGVRLTFFDWGEQNGGKAERDDRYNFALEKLGERGHSATVQSSGVSANSGQAPEGSKE